MKVYQGRVLCGLRRTKLGLPAVLLSCCLFFLAGFFGFMPQSQDERAYQSRMLELGTEELLAMPHGEIGVPNASPLNYQVLSWKPRAIYFPKFASTEQCWSIIKMAKVNLRPSAVASLNGGNAEDTIGARTSSDTFIRSSNDSTGTLYQIEEKIARATMIPRENGEAFNIIRYEIGQRYASHYDAFNPSIFGPQKSQRVASFLLYLTDVEEGGETMFPFENGLNMDIGYDYEKCIGLKVKPHQGDGLLFYSVLPNGTIDQMSLHGGCPVIRGEKWVATKWIRDKNHEIHE